MTFPDSRVQVLKEEERRAQLQFFMWLFRSGEDGLPAIILYGYSPTRSGSHAKEFLEGYHGYLKFLLDHRPTKEMTDDQLAKLAPWSQKLQFIKNRM